MSYGRDPDGHTRGVGAIAAYDRNPRRAVHRRLIAKHLVEGEAVLAGVAYGPHGGMGRIDLHQKIGSNTTTKPPQLPPGGYGNPTAGTGSVKAVLSSTVGARALLATKVPSKVRIMTAPGPTQIIQPGPLGFGRKTVKAVQPVSPTTTKTGTSSTTTKTPTRTKPPITSGGGGGGGGGGGYPTGGRTQATPSMTPVDENQDIEPVTGPPSSTEPSHTGIYILGAIVLGGWLLLRNQEAT